MAVLDSKAGAFGTPFFVPNRAFGIRSFVSAVHDKELVIGQHPEDFSLFVIGEFREDSGELVPCVPENLGVGSSFLREVSSASQS